MKQDGLLVLPDYKHTCPRYTTGDINSKCLACAYEDGAKAQLAKSHKKSIVVRPRFVKHRLDRPELRGKIKEIIRELKPEWEEEYVEIWIGKILALIPDIEEAKREERERMWDLLESYRSGDNEKGLLYTIPHRDWVAFRRSLREGK